MGRSPRIPELDGLRGAAILLVLMWHFLPSTLPGWVSAPLWLKPISMAMELGWTGVTLFFVLSGFLIGGIILDKRANTTTADFFKSFYTRRTLRIFPLY